MVRKKQRFDEPKRTADDGGSTSTTTTFKWNYCFFCSTKIEGGSEGAGGDDGSETGTGSSFNRGHELLLKFLLKDCSLESSLGQTLVGFIKDGDNPSCQASTSRDQSAASSLFAVQFCSECDQLGNTLQRLQLQIESIQKRIEKYLTRMRRGILSTSRLYGGSTEVESRFQDFEGALNLKEQGGIGCKRERKFLDLLHQFQTFIFEDADSSRTSSFTGNVGREKVVVGALPKVPVESDHEVKDGDSSCKMEWSDEEAEDSSDSENSQDEIPIEIPTPKHSRSLEQQNPLTTGTVRPKPPSLLKIWERDLLRMRLDVNFDFTGYYKGSSSTRSEWTCEICNVTIRNTHLSGLLVEEHFRQHETREKPYNCSLCNIKFTQKQYFAAHFVFYHKTKVVSCDSCEEKVRLCDMLSHLKSHSQKVYYCRCCSLSFGKFENLVSHAQLHIVKIKMKCELCPPGKDPVVLLDVRDSLPKHLCEDHGIKSFLLKCRFPLCTETFSDRTKKKDHEENHASLPRPRPSYRCIYCNASYTSKSSLLHHKIKHNLPKSVYLCELCPQVKLCSEAAWRKHRYELHGIGKPPQPRRYFKCHICSARRSQKVLLDKHIKDMHNTPHPYGLREKYGFIYQRNEDGKLQCTVCKETLSLWALSAHYVQQHNYPQYECERCPGRLFPSFEKLFSHIRTKHRGIKYQCSLCPKVYTTKTGLKDHRIGVHAGIKEFTCEICGFSTHTRSLLHEHSKSHLTDSEKKLLCSYCPKRFAKKCVLKVHMAQHTGEKPYKCQQCEAAFIQRVSLKRHIKKCHEGQVENAEKGIGE